MLSSGWQLEADCSDTTFEGGLQTNAPSLTKKAHRSDPSAKGTFAGGAEHAREPAQTRPNNGACPVAVAEVRCDRGESQRRYRGKGGGAWKMWNGKIRCGQNLAQIFKYHCKIWHSFVMPNSIAFGKAPRREADSQPISQSGSQLGKQAGRQAGRNTQFGFLSVADCDYKHWGTRGVQEHSVIEWSNTRPMVRPVPVQFPASGSAIAGSADRSTSSPYYTRPWFKSF